KNGIFLIDDSLYICTSDGCKLDDNGIYNGIMFFKIDFTNSNINDNDHNISMKNIGKNEIMNVSDYFENGIYVYKCENGSCSIPLKNGMNIISIYEKDNIDYIKIEDLNENIINIDTIKLVYFRKEFDDIVACKTLSGYIKDKSNYYTVSLYDSIISTIYTEAQNSTDCSNNIGKLIQVKGNEVVYLCLSENHSVQFSSINNEHYILETNNITDNIIIPEINRTTIRISIKEDNNKFLFNDRI
ncbi:hypothetical protein PIROE2DRAFT_10019, partial [Piromyces sp. E2]